MCSACSGDPEDPPEGLPELDAEEASPLQAWWREPVEEVEEGQGGSASQLPPAVPDSDWHGALTGPTT